MRCINAKLYKSCTIIYFAVFKLFILNNNIITESLTLNQWVWGSNPHAPTISKALENKAFFVAQIKICLISKCRFLVKNADSFTQSCTKVVQSIKHII